MNVCFLCALLLVLSALPSAIPAGPDQIIELFRHGATSPTTKYDPSWSELGMLTPVGLRQHYILGKALSQKYPTVFGDTYNFTQVYSLSSNVPRCMQSASAHLYGIYGGKGPSLKNNYPIERAFPPFDDTYMGDLANSMPNTQATPDNYVPDALNVADQTNIQIFKGDHGAYCPNMGFWDAQNRKDSKTRQTFDAFRDTINNLNRVLDANHQIGNPSDLMNFADAMLADIYDNRPLPGGISDPNLINNVTWAYTWFMYHFAQGQQIQKELSAFHLVDAILDQLISFRYGKIYNKAVLLSGYDTNIIALLSAFGIMNEECIMDNFYSVVNNGNLLYPNCHYPHFASNIVVEFYNFSSAPYVKLYYDNVPLLICNQNSEGKYECPLTEFVTFSNHSIGSVDYQDYYKKCTVDLTPPPEPQPDWLSIHIYSNLAIGLLCLALIGKITWDRMKFRKEIREVRGKIRAYEQAYRVKTKLEIEKVNSSQ